MTGSGPDLEISRAWLVDPTTEREGPGEIVVSNAFYHSLLSNYGAALVDFTADRLKIFPSNVDADATRATVRTEVKRSNGDRVSVNYYMTRTPQGWKAWDVVIDGISYVNSYRTDFSAQIEQQGIDAVIKRLEAGEKPGAIGRQTATKS